MSGLNRSIENWRRQLKANGSLDDAAIDEMEDHLRSSLPELLDKGLSADDAVLLAAARLEGAAGSTHHAVATQTVRHPILRTLLDVLVCVAAGFGCLITVMITLYALTYQHITQVGVGLSLVVGGAVCVLMVYLIRKAIIDIHRTTTGTPTTG